MFVLCGDCDCGEKAGGGGNTDDGGDCCDGDVDCNADGEVVPLISDTAVVGDADSRFSSSLSSFFEGDSMLMID
jgi:hypothetical protein